MAPKETAGTGLDADDDWLQVDEEEDGLAAAATGAAGAVADDDDDDGDDEGGPGAPDGDGGNDGAVKAVEAGDGEAVAAADGGEEAADADAGAGAEEAVDMAEDAGGGDGEEEEEVGSTAIPPTEEKYEPPPAVVPRSSSSSPDGTTEQQPSASAADNSHHRPALLSLSPPSESEFYEGDRAMYVRPPPPASDAKGDAKVEGEGEGGGEGGASNEPAAVRVRILKVEPPRYTIALPDGTTTTIDTNVDRKGSNDGSRRLLYTLDEYEHYLNQEQSKSESGGHQLLGIVTTDWYGGSGGGPFDDILDLSPSTQPSVDYYKKRHVVEVGVRSGSIVDGIQIRYSDHTVTELHGGDGGGRHTLSLGGGEYITQVVIRYGRFVHALTFTTNLGRTVGPYGGKGALLLGLTSQTVHLCAPGPRYMLVGFHGRCGKFLDGVGCHWGPVTVEAETASRAELETRLKKRVLLKSSDLYGGQGDGGNDHDDGHYNIRITDVTVRVSESKDVVKGIDVRYYNGKIGSHGGTRGGKEMSLTLERNEYVTEITVAYDELAVLSLTLRTNLGRQLGPCGTATDVEGEGGGSMGGNVRVAVVSAPDGYMLVGIKGRTASTTASSGGGSTSGSANRLGSIGFNWSPAPKE